MFPFRLAKGRDRRDFLPHHHHGHGESGLVGHRVHPGVRHHQGSSRRRAHESREGGPHRPVWTRTCSGRRCSRRRPRWPRPRANLAKELAGVEMLKARVSASIEGTRAAVQNLGEKHRRNKDLIGRNLISREQVRIHQGGIRQGDGAFQGRVRPGRRSQGQTGRHRRHPRGRAAGGRRAGNGAGAAQPQRRPGAHLGRGDPEDRGGGPDRGRQPCRRRRW